MKQIQKILTFIIGMMILASPVALGQEADTVYATPTDTLHFTGEIGCPVTYVDVIDFAKMFEKLVPLSGEKRDEALQILEDAINTPKLREYFEFELKLVPGVDDFSVEDFTVLGQDNDENNEEDDQSDQVLRVFFSEFTFIIEWRDAGFTTLDIFDEPDKTKKQYDMIDKAIDMYFVIRHEYEVSQTPQRYPR